MHLEIGSDPSSLFGIVARILVTEDQYSVGRIHHPHGLLQKCGVFAVQLPESRVLNFSGF